MKRRDLIKSTILSTVGAMVLSGCHSSDNMEYKDKEDLSNITPKQTDIYKFSAPMLFSFKGIDELASYNEKYKKSKIETLYNSYPAPLCSNFNDWVHFQRGINPDIKSFNDFKKYVKYSQEKGFKVTYLMNSNKPFTDRDFLTFKDDFYRLLDNLYNIGIKQIKISNPQVARLINEYNKDIEIQGSNLLMYSHIDQYKNFIQTINNVTHINISKDENQNFRLLKNLKQMFPDIAFEMLLGEGCPKNCPSRYSCMAVSDTYNDKSSHLGCVLLNKKPILSRLKDGNIHPWDLDYYSKIGINNFKIVQMGQRGSDKDTSNILMTIDIAEYKLDSQYANSYIRKVIPDGYKIPNYVSPETIISLLPKLSFFVKNGHMCAADCGVRCVYCHRKAKELKEFMSHFS